MSNSATLWTIQSMALSRPGHWSGEPFPSPGNLPDPGIEPGSPALQAGSLQLSYQGSPRLLFFLIERRNILSSPQSQTFLRPTSSISVRRQIEGIQFVYLSLYRDFLESSYFLFQFKPGKRDVRDKEYKHFDHCKRPISL